MSNHFDYLLQGTDVKPSVGADRLMLMAKTASRRYIDDRTPMTDTIVKMASENDLNSHQVERVCEMANMATHQTLWPQAADKEKLAFPLANPKMVIIRLGRGGGAAPASAGGCAPPPREIQSDYASAPCLPSSGPSLASLFGAPSDGAHNGMHDDGPKKRVIVILQKKAAEKSDIQNKLITKTMRYESLKKEAYDAVRQEVLQGTSLMDIDLAARAAGFGKLAAEVLPEFRDSLVESTNGQIRARLEKVAIGKAPEELVSDQLGNMTVVNGAHPVLVSLDTLHKQDGEIKQLFTSLARVNDELKVYGQKLREMR